MSAGFSVTLYTPPLPELALLLPRQPVRATTKMMANSKKKTGTATMHEPSSRPFARREHNVVDGKLSV